MGHVGLLEIQSCRAGRAQLSPPVTLCTARIASVAPAITNLSTSVAKQGPGRKKIIRERLFIMTEKWHREVCV